MYIYYICIYAYICTYVYKIDGGVLTILSKSIANDCTNTCRKNIGNNITNTKTQKNMGARGQ